MRAGSGSSKFLTIAKIMQQPDIGGAALIARVTGRWCGLRVGCTRGRTLHLKSHPAKNADLNTGKGKEYGYTDA